MVNNWLNIIQDCLLPPTCIFCGESGQRSQDLCEACYHSLVRNNFCCYRCGEIYTTAKVTTNLCGKCLKQTPAFDQTHAPFLYQGPLRHLIYTLKYNSSYKNARLLGLLLAESLQHANELPDCIIPVPLHYSRYRERGFNQSIEIARTVSKRLQVPLDLYSCQRIRNTEQQTNLTAKQRRKNLRNAFSLCKHPLTQHAAILDDVMTTGSTVNELAKILKKAGVRKVDVWVCARA